MLHLSYCFFLSENQTAWIFLTFFLSIPCGKQESSPAHPQGSSQGMLRAASASTRTKMYSPHQKVCPQGEGHRVHSTDPLTQPGRALKSGYLTQRSLISKNEMPEFCSPTGQPCQRESQKAWGEQPQGARQSTSAQMCLLHPQQSDPSLEMGKDGCSEAKEPTVSTAPARVTPQLCMLWQSLKPSL